LEADTKAEKEKSPGKRGPEEWRESQSHLKMKEKKTNNSSHREKTSGNSAQCQIKATL